MATESWLNLALWCGVLAAAIGFLIWCARGGEDLPPLAAALIPDDPPPPHVPDPAPAPAVVWRPRPKPDLARQRDAFVLNLARPIRAALVAAVLFALVQAATSTDWMQLAAAVALIDWFWSSPAVDAPPPLTPAEQVADDDARINGLWMHGGVILLGCLPFTFSAFQHGRLLAVALVVDAVAAWRLLSPFADHNAATVAALAADYDPPPPHPYAEMLKGLLFLGLRMLLGG